MSKCLPLQAMTDKIVNYYSNEIVNNILKNMLEGDPKSGEGRKYYMSVWHGIYRRHLLEANHIRFLSEKVYLSEDIIFHLNVIPKCKVITFVPDYFYFYCLNSTSLTNSYRNDRIEKTIALCNYIRKELKDEGFYDITWEERIQRLTLSYFIFSLRSCFRNKVEDKLAKNNFYTICHYLKASDFYQIYPIKYIPLKQRILIFTFKHELFWCCRMLFTYA